MSDSNKKITDSESKKDTSVKTKGYHPGIPCSPESLKEYEQVWTGIEEAIDFVNKYGKDM